MNVESVRNAIKLLEQIDPKDENAYEKAILSLNSIKHLPIFTHEIETGSPFFRSRPTDSVDLITNIDEISMPPIKFTNKFLRCNKPFQQLFYCSETRPISFLELVTYWAQTKELGDLIYVTVGRWLLRKPINALIITTPNISDRKSQYDLKYGPILDSYINQFDSETRVALKEFNEYLFIKFRAPKTDNSNIYIITSAYFNLCLTYDGANIDAVAYPSVPARQIGMNLAIRSNYILDKNLS